MVYEIKDKIVLITGGSAGIGLACVVELLRNGAKGITIASTNPENGNNALSEVEQEFGSNKVIFVKTDVTKLTELEDAYKTTLEIWNTIDIVINNAGIMEDNSWEREIAVNCNAIVQGTLLGLKYMRRDHGGKGGTIVNVSSIFGILPLDICPIYAGTKHFIIGFSRSLDSFHFERSGVRVLVLCPGITHTELFHGGYKDVLTEFTADIETYSYTKITSIAAQTSGNVARGLIKILRQGENGSCWVAEDDETAYEIDIPYPKNMRKN